MKLNVRNPVYTFEGGKAFQSKPVEELKRISLACMLFENKFYEKGNDTVERIKKLCGECKFEEILETALTASKKYLLRHTPLQLLVEALKHKDKSKKFVEIGDEIINRPDQMTDLLTIYWKDGKKPLAHQLKKLLANSFKKFDEYQLAKYNRDNPIKLRDILFLCHAKPKDKEQEDLWKRLVNKDLKTPDTWEVSLSAGKDKKETFQNLLLEKKLGKLALLRNMRNMFTAGVPKELVSSELLRNTKEMLPFQYLAAARECPAWEDIIDAPMIKAASLKPQLPGKTILLVDVSGSMSSPMSSKSVMTYMDAACGMAILVKESIRDLEIYSFSEKLVQVPPRTGMALRDAIVKSQSHGATYLGGALQHISSKPCDRIIVITDEQNSDVVPVVKCPNKYIFNIGGYAYGIGNKNNWVTVSGFSENSIDFIRELENSSQS